MSSETITTAGESSRPTGPEPAGSPAPGGASASLASRAADLWARLDQLLVVIGDYLNPILVKETRQALKSTQFTITFVLVLLACWIVTIAGVAFIGPSIFYAAAGGTLLMYYYAVLAFPLTVVVPYAAFRSLAAEREDNTYDLLSITALKSRQIISGKLGSSVVQMAVYFSAITPCLAFTYLLRGVDVPTIALLLIYSFFGSLGLSMLGILLATLTVQRFAQVFISVAFVSLLLGAFYIAMVSGYALIAYSYMFTSDNEFKIVVSAMATAYITFFALAFFASVGMITFTSENRSTPLRICMLLQQAAFVGWIAYGWTFWGMAPQMLIGMAFIAAIYWFIMGAMLTAERAEMTHRVRRRLPTSTLARMFFTWFNPGPGTGYMFMIANGTTIVVVCLVGMVIGEIYGNHGNPWWPTWDVMIYLLAVGWGYVVAYIGLGMLVVRGLRRFTLVTMLASALIHVLIVLAGAGIPTVIQFMSIEMRYQDYSLIQVSNPFWSLKHLSDGGISTDGYVLILVVPAAALCMIMLNMSTIIRELQAVRVASPTRVIEDEAELHPLPESLPSNPWDAEP